MGYFLPVAKDLGFDCLDFPELTNNTIDVSRHRNLPKR
jgi:hypothetical protein